MSTIDTSTWNPDAGLNTEIEGIPLNADAGIAQTWQALRVLMAAVKGDGDAIKAMITVMQGATASADGASGLVPQPLAGDQDKLLKGDGTWGTASTAAEAESVPWGGVTGKPSTFTPSSHAHGNLTNDGKLGTASRAMVTDGNGSIDVSTVSATELNCLSGVTSAVQTQLNAKATDTGVVHNTGDESIAGQKTFSNGSIKIESSSGTNSITIKNTDFEKGNTSHGNVHSDYYFRDKTDNNISFIRTTHYPASGQTFLRLTAMGGAGLDKNCSCFVTSEGDGTRYFRPDANGATGLGTASNRWGQIYSAQSTISTSDRRLKTKPEKIPDAVLDAWEEVDFVQFKMLDSVSKKGYENARLHNGLIAQNIEEKFAKNGLNAREYGLLCWDKWQAEAEKKDLDGTVLTEAREAGDMYSLRYVEALCMEAAYQRRRADRLESRINHIESLLQTILSEKGNI